jgi:penicillin amidase
MAEAMADNLPIEFLELQYKPEPWKIEDSLAIGKAMSWELCGSMDDLYLGTLVEKLGWEAVDELFPINRYREVPIIPADEREEESPKEEGEPEIKLPDGVTEASLAIIDAHSRCARILGAYNNIGSNNWVISGKKSASGAPILASDPHLGFHMPSVWYAAHIKGGSLNVLGVTLPGLPIVTIGRNRRVAWGLTNTQADGTDFFSEILNDERTHYLHKGEWKPLVVAKEKIKVRGGGEKELQIPITAHGPILSASPQNLAMQWIGAEPDDDALAYYLLSHAVDFDDFAAAMETINTPPQNFVYADSNGMIALWVAGLFPVRASGLGRIPVDGSSGEFDWAGFVPRIDTPHSVNPPQGYLASANQRPAPESYPYYLGYEWDPGYRARRINFLLFTNDSITQAQMKQFQADTFDTAAQSMLPRMIESCRSQFEEGTVYARALGALSGWDFVTSAGKSAPTIWWAWLDSFRDHVWKDEWTAAGLELRQEEWGHADLNKWQPPLEVLERMVLEEPASKWFDDVSTAERETLSEIAGRSFREATDNLAERFGPDTAAWTWGRVNRLRINHLLGNPILARGGQPLSGSDLTLSARGAGGEVTGGPSWRMVVDFAGAGEACGVYPGGQSGDPQSPHYDDLLDEWVKDQYIPLHFYADAEQFPDQEVENRLILSASSDSETIFAPE